MVVTEPAKSPAPGARQPAFHVTPEAALRIRQALDKRGTPDAALRVGVKGGGCSGFSYVLEFADGPAREGRDLVFRYPAEGGEVRVYCDKKSILYLDGATLEWEKTLKWQGFKFANPKATGSCGCKESFSV